MTLNEPAKAKAGRPCKAPRPPLERTEPLSEEQKRLDLNQLLRTNQKIQNRSTVFCGAGEAICWPSSLLLTMLNYLNMVLSSTLKWSKWSIKVEKKCVPHKKAASVTDFLLLLMSTYRFYNFDHHIHGC